MRSVKGSLLFIPLGILALLTLISLLTGNDFMATALVESQHYQQILDGVSSAVEFADASADFTLDPLIFAVIWIVVIGVIAVASSITVLATGLGSGGSKWVVGMVFFISLWLMLSTYPYPMITAGGIVMDIIYLGMTISYAIGGVLTLMEVDI